MAEQAALIPGLEADLIVRARRRDQHAIRTIVKTYNQRLYRIARGILKDDGEAEDALQDAYVRAFGNLDGFRGDAAFGTWLARIVINECLAALRRRKQAVKLSRAVEDFALADIIPFPNGTSVSNPEHSLAQRQVQALLENAIDSLPDSFRCVVIARLVEGMSVEETAELFEIPPPTVKTRLHRARLLLQRDVERRMGPMLDDAFPFAGQRCARLTDRVLCRLGLS